MRPRVNLPSGGSIIIETTEALTVIDVNSGNTGGRHLEDTILRTNFDAAAEIARQVRLRDIGGIIVCDFIDMASEAARNKVLKVLEDGLRRDRTRTTIQSFSALGLLEFTRKRVGKDLSQQLRDACPTCSGLGSVLSPDTMAIDTLRRLRATGHVHENGKSDKTKAAKQYEVVAAPTVGAELDFWYEDELVKLEESLGTKVRVRIDEAIHPERTRDRGARERTRSRNCRGSATNSRPNCSRRGFPNPISALAVYEGNLIEVEGGAPAVGRTIKIKVIDVDDEATFSPSRASRSSKKSSASAAAAADAAAARASSARPNKPTNSWNWPKRPPRASRRAPQSASPPSPRRRPKKPPPAIRTWTEAAPRRPPRPNRNAAVAVAAGADGEDARKAPLRRPSRRTPIAPEALPALSVNGAEPAERRDCSRRTTEEGTAVAVAVAVAADVDAGVRSPRTAAKTEPPPGTARPRSGPCSAQGPTVIERTGEVAPPEPSRAIQPGSRTAAGGGTSATGPQTGSRRAEDRQTHPPAARRPRRRR